MVKRFNGQRIAMPNHIAEEAAQRAHFEAQVRATRMNIARLAAQILTLGGPVPNGYAAQRCRDAAELAYQLTEAVDEVGNERAKRYAEEMAAAQQQPEPEAPRLVTP